MQFANPIWLAALGGIFIPLAIHLLSRKEGKVIRIGSIRHFEETSTRQFKSIKLNEILLLILRSLLILLIVFFLAGLQWPGSSSGDSKWLLIEKGLDHNADLSKIINGLTEKGFEKRAFAKGFPVAGDTITERPDNYWTLVEALSKEQLDTVVIITANRINAFRGERKRLPANVSWISEPLPKKEEVIDQVRLNADSVWVRTGNFTGTESEFTNKIISGGASETISDSIQVVLVIDKQYAYDAKLLFASLKAIDRYTPHVVLITRTDRASFQENKNSDFIFWLSDETAPTNDQVIAIKPQPSQNIIESTSNTTWIITQRLTPENVVEENLTSKLTQLLFPEKETWKKADELDIRMSEHLAEPNTATSENVLATTHSGEVLWIILIALTFITERIVSYKRMQ